jgi:hypothetical protein
MVMSDDGIPDFDDDPTIDTVYSLYSRERTDLHNYSKESLEEFEYAFTGGIRDIVQPCGVTESIMDRFYADYKKRHDIAELIAILKSNPVYGLSDISDEIIRLLEKSRTKPVPEKVYETEELHKKVKWEFSKLNPERGQADNAYADIAFALDISVENVKTIIKRARKSGWDGELLEDGLAINKRPSSDKT